MKYFFHHDTAYTQPTEQNNTTLYPSSGWTPPSGQDPFLESYRSTIIDNTLKEIKKKSNRHFKRNLKKEEWTAITTLRNNKDIVIKPADQELEDMNKQILAELEVSSSSSESSLDSPKQDLDDLQDHPEDWLVIDEL